MLLCPDCLAAFFTAEGLAAHPCVGKPDKDPDRPFRKFVNTDTRAFERDDDLGKLEGTLEDTGGEE